MPATSRSPATQPDRPHTPPNTQRPGNRHSAAQQTPTNRRSQSATIERLRQQLRTSVAHTQQQDVVPTDFVALNRLLPDQGIRSGSVVEWISSGPGSRTSTMAFAAAGRLLQQPGALAVVDPLHCLCAASLPQAGIPLSRLLLVRPKHTTAESLFVSQYRLPGPVRSDALWALEQLARSTGVRVVLTWIDRLSSTAQRRLQLAVERSGTTVFLIRPASALQQPTWSDLRFLVSANGSSVKGTGAKSSAHHTSTNPTSQWHVQLIRSRNSVHSQGHTRLECQHETGVVSEVL
ncbi:MAG: hypothetical protein NXI04_00945 [Planctomycetaceae bacterium]|nr:hypothetical protein [Planctomycetaceae bacterium]